MKLTTTIVLHGLDPSGGPSIRLPGGSTVAPGAPLAISVAKGPGNRRDWVGLSTVGSQDGSVVAWVYLSGIQTLPPVGLTAATVNLTAPSDVGNYEARFYVNDGYTVLARARFAVQGTAPPQPPLPPPGEPTDIVVFPAVQTLRDNSPAGTVVARVSVTMSNGTLFSDTLTSTDPLFVFHGLDLLTSRAMTMADDGTHHTTLTASQNGQSISATLSM